MNIHLRDGSTTEDTRLGRLVEAASACNRLHWGRGERIGVLLTVGISGDDERHNKTNLTMFRPLHVRG